MVKKLFFISLAVFLILVIAWIAYFFAFSRSSNENLVDTPQPENTSKNPSSSEEGINELMEEITSTIKQVSDFPVVGAHYSLEENTIYTFHKQTGVLYSIDPNTRSKTIRMEPDVPNIITAIWNKEGTRFYVKFRPGNENVFSLYSLGNPEPIWFKKNTDYLTWDNLSSKVLYVYADPETNNATLNIANPDGSDWSELTPLENRFTKIATIPASPNISYWPSPQHAKRTNLQSINILTQEITPILSDRFGADYLWSPNGKKTLFSFAPIKNDPTITLGVMNKDGGQVSVLNNAPTLVNKCVWSRNNIDAYCAVPTGIPESTLLPDDYLSQEITTQDTFWKIDTESGATQRIVEVSDINRTYDASELFLSPNEQILYFIDRTDNFLHSINL